MWRDVVPGRMDACCLLFLPAWEMRRAGGGKGGEDFWGRRRNDTLQLAKKERLTGACFCR